MRARCLPPRLLHFSEDGMTLSHKTHSSLVAHRQALTPSRQHDGHARWWSRRISTLGAAQKLSLFAFAGWLRLAYTQPSLAQGRALSPSESRHRCRQRVRFAARTLNSSLLGFSFWLRYVAQGSWYTGTRTWARSSCSRWLHRLRRFPCRSAQLWPGIERMD